MTKLRFLAFSCVHVPYHDTDAIDYLHRQIKETKPDRVICLGDLLDAEAASKFPKEGIGELLEEFAVADELLETIRRVAIRANEKSRCVFLPGNHEDNILSIDRIPPGVRSLCDYRVRINELSNWIQPSKGYADCPVSNVYRIGQVAFTHGNATGHGTIEWEAYRYSHDNGLFIHGHTHRPHAVRPINKGQGKPLRCHIANAGCMRHMKPEWVKRRDTSLWGHAVVVGEAKKLKSPRMEVCWSAETRIHQMYDEWARNQP